MYKVILLGENTMEFYILKKKFYCLLENSNISISYQLEIRSLVDAW